MTAPAPAVPLPEHVGPKRGIPLREVARVVLDVDPLSDVDLPAERRPFHSASPAPAALPRSLEVAPLFRRLDTVCRQGETQYAAAAATDLAPKPGTRLTTRMTVMCFGQPLDTHDGRCTS